MPQVIPTKRSPLRVLLSGKAEGNGSLAYAALRQAKRLIILVVGVTVVLLGVAMLALPGPGSLVLIAGLAILASEFIWARSLMKRVRNMAASAADRMSGVRKGDFHAKPSFMKRMIMKIRVPGDSDDDDASTPDAGRSSTTGLVENRQSGDAP